MATPRALEPAPPSAASSTDAVFVRGLEFEASHGYTAAERRATRRFRVSLELRKYIVSHTDTFTIGPISADQALARLGQQ